MIEIQDFAASYGEKQILHTINLAFNGSDITALIGPSGCGKTTLLKSMNRTAELQPGFRASGRILLTDKDVYTVKNPANVRRQIGMVLQKPIALPLSIKENILFGPRYYGGKTKAELESIVEGTLTSVGLWQEVKEKLNSPAGQLSGGQLQRLSIGRILAVAPQVLLLDEPCSSLDIKSTQMIEELLLELRSRVTIIIVTHNLAQARRIADKTVFMAEGRVMEHNTTKQLFEQPENPVTQEFLAF
ncbi:Phosphate import ATP-binding protein PstB [Sporomusa rhizae]|uniref:phosphate ABC transporter ATP-binding protein n=1 Tax=Sporomusa rhizae TaxID=357999 RepID=UPI00352AC8D2